VRRCGRVRSCAAWRGAIRGRRVVLLFIQMRTSSPVKSEKREMGMNRDACGRQLSYVHSSRTTICFDLCTIALNGSSSSIFVDVNRRLHFARVYPKCPSKSPATSLTIVAQKTRSVFSCNDIYTPSEPKYSIYNFILKSK
jgi:hypothetical protein